MPVIPIRNLPPDAEPWGRSVDSRLTQLERDATSLAQGTDNTLGGVNSALRKIGEQITDLQQTTALALAAANAATSAANQANAAVADLAARVSVTNSIPSFNTGNLPNDGTTHWYGSDIDITVNVPTGRLLIMVGCSEATVEAGGSAGQGICTFSIPGIANLGDYQGRNYLYSTTDSIGTPLILVEAVSVPPGIHTVTGKMGAWASGTSTASVNFRRPFMTVQVTA